MTMYIKRQNTYGKKQISDKFIRKVTLVEVVGDCYIVEHCGYRYQFYKVDDKFQPLKIGIGTYNLYATKEDADSSIIA